MLRTLLAATALAATAAVPASALPVCVYVYDAVGTFSVEACVPPSSDAPAAAQMPPPCFDVEIDVDGHHLTVPVCP